ncbi:Methanogenesis regulatory histidine kinase FilI [uncultured archaeon]|nr:Methanogenesis regulatory histidine kinase FilI [uncultured archaeon]
MKDSDTGQDPGNNLGSRAEDALKHRGRALQPGTDGLGDTAALVHELQVHQIELEMQNEEMKRAKFETEDALAKYSDLYEFAPIGLFTLDRRGQILEVNLQGANILGAERYILLKTGFDLFVTESDRPALASFLEAAFRVGTRQECELELLKRGGTATYVKIECLAKSSQTNDRQLWIAVTDITERRAAEKALRDSKDYLNQIINRIGDPIFVKDREHRFALVNKAMCALAGRPPEELIGNTDYDFFPKAQSDNFWGQDDLVFGSGEEKVNEEEITDAEGDVRTIVTKKTLFVDGAGNRHIVGVIRDITERKGMEKELCRSRDELDQRVGERTADLEAKNAEMERFIYTVSHDLRSPLISVSGFLGFLRQDADNGDGKLIEADLQIIADSVARMDRLLTDTLELSRIGRVIEPPVDVPFGEIAEEALNQTRQKIASEGFDVSVAPEMPFVHVDRMRIAEVLVNLIENSIRYTRSVDRPKIEIGCTRRGEETIFFVRDNGIGIDPSQHKKVFELFYKVDRKSAGTGVGMAIVKRIIEVHGGRIWIESELGLGCIVCFTLPLAGAGQANPPA